MTNEQQKKEKKKLKKFHHHHHQSSVQKMLSRLATSVLGRAVKKAPPSRIPAAITLVDFSDDFDDEREGQNGGGNAEKEGGGGALLVLERWKSFSDADFGGRSRASLTRSSNGRGSAVFEGTLDSSVPALKDEKMREIRSLKRSGFAGFGWNDVKVNLKKKEEKGDRDENDEEYEIDLEHFTHVRMTMKNHDGRAHVCSIKTERDAFGNGEHDLWQAFLLAPKTSDENASSFGNWTELTVPLSQFMKTYKGGVVMSQTIGGKDSLRKRGNMKTFSIACGGLESGKGDMDGPFRLEVKKIELLDVEKAELVGGDEE